MRIKKQSGRKWTAAQKLAQSKKIKKALRAKKANGGPIIVDSAQVLRMLVRRHIADQLPAIIKEEVRSALG